VAVKQRSSQPQAAGVASAATVPRKVLQPQATAATAASSCGAVCVASVATVPRKVLQPLLQRVTALAAATPTVL
jgi:hypothetical protein